MIQFVLLLAILVVAYLPFRSLIFELCAITLLIIPVEAFLIGQVVPPNSILYGALILLTIAVVYLTVPQEEKQPISFSDLLPVVLWAFLFVVALSYEYRWCDFMPMGERLRDYALLSEVMKYPINPQEPWMSGAPINYYLYWYRFGGFLGGLLHFETWQMYHLLQAVTFSLYIVAAFRILTVIAQCSAPFALAGALLIGFGSNLEGVLYTFADRHDWWGPSRVIAGAINEFPAWSYLLGDLHPHYLNLCLFPLILLFSFRLFERMPLQRRYLVLPILYLGVAPLWIYNSNAWEVPPYFFYIGFFFAIYLFSLERVRQIFFQSISKVRNNITNEFFRNLTEDSITPPSSFRWQEILAQANKLPKYGEKLLVRLRESFEQRYPQTPLGTAILKVLADGATSLFWFIVQCVVAVLRSSHTPYVIASLICAYSLYLSSRNIIPGSDHFRLVKDPIKSSTTVELLRHWGLPLLLIFVSLSFLVQRTLYTVFFTFITALCFIVGTGKYLIISLFIFNFIRLLKKSSQGFSMADLFIESLGCLSLFLILVPEYVFLDDPYGGESERMNTIFKAYAANWALIHLFAFWLMWQVFRQATFDDLFSRVGVTVTATLFTGIMMGFFVHTTADRRSDNYDMQPIQQGLSQLEKRYPGAGIAFKQFQSLPDGVTLESQGDPYSLTSHVATLGGKRSYLGWINHVDLLIRNYSETKRRADVTTSIYNSHSCDDVKGIMRLEKIRYVVVGPLEHERFQSLDNGAFSCLKQVVTSTSYAVFELPA